ncbi:MAG: ferrous iron transport protein B, partial [Methanophagales archaeon]|nr:ferrous iron transport protein B [Methanophagales archaeon]
MKLRIILVGQPNVGKSCLLNALVGPEVIVSNYPGTTVEVTTAEKTVAGEEIEFLDSPGIYSISDRSEEEKVAEKALFEEEIDGAIIIADSVSLERSLYLTFQVLEAEIPVVIALNFVESAEKKGIIIAHKKLSKILGAPVIPINPLTKRGMGGLVNALLEIKETKKTFTVRYDDHIEDAIREVSSQVTRTQLPKRFVALRVLEEDADFYGYLSDKRTIKAVKEGLIEHPKVAEDIAITRYGTAAFITEKVTHLVHVEEAARSLDERLDGAFLHSLGGPILTILTFVTIFGALLFIGSWIQDILTGFTEYLLSLIHLGVGFSSTALEAGLAGMMAGISIALPYVFIFYILFTLIEDAGLLSRYVVNLERFLRWFNLPGSAIIPLALGLGCTVPATRSTRILFTKKEKFFTAALLSCVPCSSRIAIIMGVVGYFGGKWLALSVFITLFVSFLVLGYVVKRITRIEKKPVLYELPELPPYRIPSIGNIVTKSWIRMKTFVYLVVPLLFLGGVAYAGLDALGLTNVIVAPLSPITWWLDLPNVAIIPLVFGFLQKDLTGSMLLLVLVGEVSSVLAPLQIYTFGVAAT